MLSLLPSYLKVKVKVKVQVMVEVKVKLRLRLRLTCLSAILAAIVPLGLDLDQLPWHAGYAKSMMLLSQRG